RSGSERATGTSYSDAYPCGLGKSAEKLRRSFSSTAGGREHRRSATCPAGDAEDIHIRRPRLSRTVPQQFPGRPQTVPRLIHRGGRPRVDAVVGAALASTLDRPPHPREDVRKGKAGD